MSDVAEEAMDSSAVSDEEVANQKETSQEDQSSPDKSRSKISVMMFSTLNPLILLLLLPPAAEDSSDDDEPLIKMVKRAPTDEQLKETVKSLLKEANLEEMTMKQICQRVFDTYPDHDLSGKKDYIKQTVKSLIT